VTMPLQKLQHLAGVDLVLAHEGELSIVADPVDGAAGGQCADAVFPAQGDRLDAGGDQKAPARIDGERSQVVDARLLSTPSLKPYTFNAPGSSGLPRLALLPRATRIALWLEGVVRIWCAKMPPSGGAGWSTRNYPITLRNLPTAASIKSGDKQEVRRIRSSSPRP
jgi:hypothetical protein